MAINVVSIIVADLISICNEKVINYEKQIDCPPRDAAVGGADAKAPHKTKDAGIKFIKLLIRIFFMTPEEKGSLNMGGGSKLSTGR